MIEQFIVAINALDLGGESVNTVNARELWEKLESKQQFSDWIKNRIEKYGFLEGADYLLHKFMTEYNQVLSIEYFISLDMAKELAMVEANEVGKMIRRHFIACEKELRAQQLAALHLEHSAKVESLRIEYRNAAEQAIQHNTHHVELLGISLHKGWLGQVHIPFNDAMDYLERVKKAYEAGYRPTYKSRLLVIEDDMLNL